MGIVDHEGEYPKLPSREAEEMCVVGPMSRHAEDLKAMLGVLAGNNAEKLKLNLKVDTTQLKVIFYIKYFILNFFIYI